MSLLSNYRHNKLILAGTTITFIVRNRALDLECLKIQPQGTNIYNYEKIYLKSGWIRSEI